jgi:hypothetical protein
MRLGSCGFFCVRVLFLVFFSLPAFSDDVLTDGPYYTVADIEPRVVSVLCPLYENPNSPNCSYTKIPEPITDYYFADTAVCSHVSDSYYRSLWRIFSNAYYTGGDDVDSYHGWSVDSLSHFNYDSVSRELTTSSLEFAAYAAFISAHLQCGDASSGVFTFLRVPDPESSPWSFTQSGSIVSANADLLINTYTNASSWNWSTVNKSYSELSYNVLMSSTAVLSDSDGDGFYDADELTSGSDPLSPSSTPENPHSTESDPNCPAGYADDDVDGVCSWDSLYCYGLGYPSNYVLYDDNTCRPPLDSSPANAPTTSPVTSTVDNDPDNDGNPGVTGGSGAGDDYDGDGVANQFDPNPTVASESDAEESGKESGVSSAADLLEHLANADRRLDATVSSDTQDSVDALMGSVFGDNDGFDSPSSAACPIDSVDMSYFVNGRPYDLRSAFATPLCSLLELCRALLGVAAYLIAFHQFMSLGFRS